MSEDTLQLENTDLVQSLLLPLEGKHLLLPNVNVAEILLSAEPEPISGAPAWVMGRVRWRGESVPLISFARLNGDGSGPHTIDRIAVLNALGDHERLAFFAVAIEGVPRQMRVMADEIITDDRVDPGAAELCRVQVSGELAAIPDLDFIEERLISCGAVD